MSNQRIKIEIMLKYSILLLFLLLHGCHGNENKSEGLATDTEVSLAYSIDLIQGMESDSKAFYLSNIADSIKFIPLETSNYSVIAQIKSISIDDNFIFIRSNVGYNNSFFYRFNLEGKFLNRIGAIGRGPGESLNSLFSLDKERDRFLVLRLDGKKSILAYNYEGIFLEELPIEVPADVVDFAWLPGGRIVFQPISKGLPAQIPQDLYLFELYNSKGELLDRKKHPIVQFRNNSYDKMLRTAINGGINPLEEEALLFHERDDTVYRTFQDKILPAFILLKGKHSPPLLERYKTLNLSQYSYLIDKGPWILETDSLVFLRQALDNKLYLFEFNRKTGLTKSTHTLADGAAGPGGYLFTDMPGFIDDISCSGQKVVLWHRTGSNGSMLAIPYTASKFIEAFSNLNDINHTNANYTWIEHRRRILENISENDNPVIVLVYLKK